MMKGIPIKGLAVVTAITLCSVLTGQAKPGEIAAEYAVKAGFLYNFCKFVEWPEEAFEHEDDPLMIGILGEDPFGSLLDKTVRDRTAQSRNIVIKRFRTLVDMEPCHVLFISKSEQEMISEILEKAKTSALLTVSEIEGFSRQGGIITFITVENKVRFEINREAAEGVGLHLSSKLLRLATTIY